MKNSKFKVFAFISILILPSLAWLLIMVISPDTFEKLDFDLVEKREKAEIESINDISTSGDVLSAFIADRAPFRSHLITFYHKMQADLEEPYEKGIKPTMLALMFGSSSGNPHVEMVQTSGSSIFSGENVAPQTNTSQSAQISKPEPEVPPVSQGKKHHFEITDSLEPTCAYEGWNLFTCTDCGESYKEIVPARGHDYFEAGLAAPTYESYGFFLNVCKVCGYWEKSQFEPKLVDDSYFAPKTQGSTIIGRYNWLFYSQDLDFYKGTNLLSDDELKDYLDTLEQLESICKQKGIKLAYMITPNKESVYPEYMPSYTRESSYNRAQQIAQYVHKNSDITFVYPLEELKYADRYWQSYYKYDTHWTKAGALVGTQILYENMGISTTDPFSLEIIESESENYGDLISLGGLDKSKYQSDKDYIFTYKRDINLTFESGDCMKDEVYYSSSTSENTDKFVLLGDSFRTLMIPIIQKDFSSVVVSHCDNVEVVADDIRNADIIVIEATERFDYSLYTAAKRVAKILSE